MNLQLITQESLFLIVIGSPTEVSGEQIPTKGRNDILNVVEA